MDTLNGLNAVFVYTIIWQLALQQAKIERFGGKYGTALSAVWQYVRDKHPRPDCITLGMVQQALEDLHRSGGVYLQHWDGDKYMPWRKDWEGFFGGFRLCAERP